MSDEAVNAHLQWLDDCARAQVVDYETWLEGRVARAEGMLSIAMSENQRLTKYVEDYEEENATLKRENEALRAQKSALLGSWEDVLGAIWDVGCRAPGEFLGKAVDYWINLKATVESHGLTGVHEKIALLEAKLAAIECGDCGKTMLECECDMENG